MALKEVVFGPWGSGKTAHSTTMAEIGNIGVNDTEQRWQWYTVPHPTMKPKTFAYNGVEIPAYANPRLLRQDIPWLPKTQNVIWLVQTMEPNLAWACSKAWAHDKTICGQVYDSASVIWDLLSDGAYAAQEENEKLGGLAWVPAKRTMRRMIYEMLAAEQHWIMVAHKQEVLNSKMQVTDVRPWVEKKTPHWADIILQFVTGEDGIPKARVEKEKLVAGVNGALKVGSVITAPTFKQMLALAGEGQGGNIRLAGPGEAEELERRAGMAASSVQASAPIKGVDAD